MILKSLNTRCLGRLLLLCGSAVTVAVAGIQAGQQNPPNILFLSADDMGTYLSCYGDEHVISPNLDALARNGMLFSRAYSQIAICNPSRASLLSGLRPDSIQVYDLVAHFRDTRPEAVSLPQHFKNHGYHTQAVGKNFHPAFSNHADVRGQPLLDDAPSWTEPLWLPSPPEYYHTERGIEEAKRVFAQTRMKPDETPEDWKNHVVRGLAVEAPEIEGDVLYDQQVTARAIEILEDLAKRQATEPPGEKTPFFLGVGFLKPHMPFIAPKEYWDLYDRDQFNLAENNFPPRDAPPIALQVFWNEARAQSDVPNTGPILPEQSRELIHGYYACISYVDSLVGRIVGTLDRLGLRDNTIIVFWSDHGFSLGANSVWGKLTNFEHSVRVPLIIALPDGRGAGQKTDALVELIDIYPSLSELAGLPLPDHLEGLSFAPLIDDPGRPWKTAAFSQYFRPPFETYRTLPLAIPNLMGYDQYPKGGAMGYTMRTDTHRFTAWYEGPDFEHVLATELYDHRKDPEENVNLAVLPEHATLIERLRARLEAGWRGALPAGL